MTEQKSTSNFLVYKPENTSLKNSNFTAENFKTKVVDEEEKLFQNTFKEKVGEDHPFEYSTVEGVARKFGLVSAITDKISDFTLGPGLFIESENDKIVKTLDKWQKKTRFKSFLRPWFREALMKGPGYLEIAGLSDVNVDDKIKVVNSNTMYAKRDKFGNIEKYNQYIGSKKGMINDDDVIPLNADEIVQFDVNKIGSGAYGMGIIYSGLSIINDYLSANKAMHKIMSRKANNPIHVKMGDVSTEDYPEQSDIDSFGKKLQYMNECTEWVTGPNVEMNVLDFGNIGEKFDEVLKHDLKLLSYSFQVPEVILGADKGFVGSSEVQEDGFDRNIKSYQEQLAFIIQTKIFDKVLLNNGITDLDYTIVWGQQSEEDKNERLTALTGLLSSSVNLSEGVRKELEKKIAIIEELDSDEIEKENKRAERRERSVQRRDFGQQLQLKTTPKQQPGEESVTSIIKAGIEKGKAQQEIESDIAKEFGDVENEKIKELIERAIRLYKNE